MQKLQDLDKKPVTEESPSNKLSWQKPELVELSIRNTESGGPSGPEGTFLGESVGTAS